MEHTMSIMKGGEDGGDEIITWDPNDKESVKIAERKFEEMVVAGHHVAFPVASKKVPDEQAGPLRKFDPDMGEIVLTMPYAGG